MSFLDDPGTDFTSPALVELRDLLVLAYRRPEAAEQLTDRAGLVPGTFPLQPTMRGTWTSAVRELLNQGHLRDLVELAAEDPTVSAYRARFKEMLEDRPPVAPPQPPIGEPGPVLGLDAGQDLLAQVISRIPERLLERRNRLIPIELAAGIVAASHSVAKLSMRFGHQPAHGTGFLINPTTLLTNHHNMVHEQLGDVTDLGVRSSTSRPASWANRSCAGARLDGIVKEPADDWATVPLESAVTRPALALGTPFSVGIDDTVAIIQHPGGAFRSSSRSSRWRSSSWTTPASSTSPIPSTARPGHRCSTSGCTSSRCITQKRRSRCRSTAGPRSSGATRASAMQRLMERLQQHHIAFTTNDGA